jgi:hypothetical protein
MRLQLDQQSASLMRWDFSHREKHQGTEIHGGNQVCVERDEKLLPGGGLRPPTRAKRGPATAASKTHSTVIDADRRASNWKKLPVFSCDFAALCGGFLPL